MSEFINGTPIVSTLNVYYYHEDNPEKKIERNSPEILRMREEKMKYVKKP